MFTQSQAVMLLAHPTYPNDRIVSVAAFLNAICS